MPRSPDVYEFYDANDRVLYVGYSLSLLDRLLQHNRTHQSWWPSVARIVVTHHPTVDEALAYEWARITELHPLHNKDTPENRGSRRRLPPAHDTAIVPEGTTAAELVKRYDVRLETAKAWLRARARALQVNPPTTEGQKP